MPKTTDRTAANLDTLSREYRAALDSLAKVRAALADLPRNHPGGSLLPRIIGKPVREALALLDSQAVRTFATTASARDWDADAPAVEERRGRKVFGPYGEAWVSFWVAPAADYPTDDDALQAAGFYGHGSGPGRPFGHAPHVRRSRSRVLVTQSAGIDV